MSEQKHSNRDSNREAMAHWIRVATWNVLAQSKTTIERFDQEPAVLSLVSRVPRIIERLECLIKSQCIIALQEMEVVLSCAGISRLFAQNHYEIVRSFGLGNWLCIPTNLYNVLDYGQHHIGSRIVIPKDVDESKWSPVPPRCKSLNVFQEARKKPNFLMWAKLQWKRWEFYVFVYHMPCCYWWPAVMALHANALKETMRSVAGGCPFILLGDFNECAHGPIYNILTNSTADPAVRPWPEWRPCEMDLLDARVIMGHPIQFTTRTRSVGKPVFEGSIDHIFYSDDRLMPMAHCVFPIALHAELPNAEEPSDHVPVVADFVTTGFSVVTK